MAWIQIPLGLQRFFSLVGIRGRIIILFGSILFPGISSKDVQPAVVQPPPYSQALPGQSVALVYDRGLIEAVTEAQNFVVQTFPGARLLESHNVSFPSL